MEFLDEVAGQGGASSAWRPWEALTPFMIDDSIRQINRFAAHSPVPQGNGVGNPMDLALITGDQADNQQRNEMIWTRALLEGGVTLNFNSGLTDPDAYSPENLPDPECQAFVTQEGGQSQAAAEAAGYTGVQDYDDYPSPPPPNFYDPNEPTGRLGRLAAVHGAPGPRPDALPHPRRPERPLLLGERQPRRPRAGERGRQPGVREHRHRLLQGAGDDARPGEHARPRLPQSERAALPHRRGCWSRPTRCGASSRSCRPRRSSAPTTWTTTTASTSSTRNRTRPRTARPPTTPGIRRRRPASASSPSTPTRRAASSAPSARSRRGHRTGTSTIRSSSGSRTS